MKATIRDNESVYEYERMNWISFNNGVLTINYQDENDEECEEFGDIPEYLEINK